MLAKAEAMDKEEEEAINKELEKYKSKSDFMKIMEHNEPLYLIAVACFASACHGFT